MRATVHIRPPTDAGFVLDEGRPGEFLVTRNREADVQFVKTSRYRTGTNRWALVPSTGLSSRVKRAKARDLHGMMLQKELEAIEMAMTRRLKSREPQVLASLCVVLDKMDEVWKRTSEMPSPAEEEPEPHEEQGWIVLKETFLVD